MAEWFDPRCNDWHEFDPIVPSEVWVTENPVVGELLGPDGEVLLQVLEREPIGYRLR